MLATSTHWFALPIFGFIVGALIGATGVGAGSLTTPALVLGFGINPVIAVGTDLIFAAVTKVVSAVYHRRLGNIDWPILCRLAAGSLPAAAITLITLAVVPLPLATLTKIIRWTLFFALMATVAAFVWRPIKVGDREGMPALRVSREPGGRTGWTRFVVIGGVLGLLVALTSIGAGAIGVVALSVAAPWLATRRIIGTDLAHAVPLTLVAGSGHFALGHLDADLLGPLLVGSLPGVLAGGRLTTLLTERSSRHLMAAILCVAAFALVLR